MLTEFDSKPKVNCCMDFLLTLFLKKTLKMTQILICIVEKNLIRRCMRLKNRMLTKIESKPK